MKFLLEGKATSNLYHITNIAGLEGILESDTLGRYQFGRISLTRNKYLQTYHGCPARAIFKLILDGESISNTYKVKPYLFHDVNDNVDFSYEQEEQVNMPIKKIKKYIRGIIIMPDTLINTLKDRNIKSFDEEDKFYRQYTFGDVKEFIHQLKNDFELYVQINNTINKDFTILKEIGLY